MGVTETIERKAMDKWESLYVKYLAIWCSAAQWAVRMDSCMVFNQIIEMVIIIV
jgi:hypothetical protein